MADFAYRQPAPVASERWFGSHSPAYNNTLHSAGFETGDNQYLSQR
ncbi:61cd5368-bf7d-4d5d-8cf8-24c36cb1ee08 [Thermothielavioides terrestris]|uniref:61cd5368-bf7d-4d5d-8cf8-24c36cb1ee08 n=1 Tax=Thermothielavioides terrestris TaxID=2587410 RepID=A0A446BK14_9PEZI|nr:61cd5368-bf7d-4d5d-8cf8-24c36cb1ee08 [Thermothielavioides terrestris]